MTNGFGAVVESFTCSGAMDAVSTGYCGNAPNRKEPKNTCRYPEPNHVPECIVKT